MEIRSKNSWFLKNLSQSYSWFHYQSGFTLIELVVVLAILGILLVGLITTFNPLAQYNKANDGKREHDLGQIQRALDSYFNDTGCYPTSLTFGVIWKVHNHVYMEKVPQDPDCGSDSDKCYLYEPDSTSSCPQWNVLYSALRSSSVPSNACPLAQRTSCVPNGYRTNNYNYCTISGSVDCSQVASYVINQGDTVPTVTGGSGGPTITPTPTPLACPGDQFYGCTGDNRCNSIAPKTQCTDYGGDIHCYCDQHCSQSCAFN